MAYVVLTAYRVHSSKLAEWHGAEVSDICLHMFIGQYGQCD